MDDGCSPLTIVLYWARMLRYDKTTFNNLPVGKINSKIQKSVYNENKILKANLQDTLYITKYCIFYWNKYWLITIKLQNLIVLNSTNVNTALASTINYTSKSYIDISFLQNKTAIVCILVWLILEVEFPGDLFCFI